MTFRILTLALIPALSLTLASGASAAHGKTRHHPFHARHAKRGHQPKSAGRLRAPSGYLLVDENAVLGMSELPRLLMADAQADFSEGNLSATYSDLRAASRALAAEKKATRSFAAKSYLVNAANRLDYLGNEVKAGMVISNRTLGSALGEILSLRASADRESAVEQWARGDVKGAGTSLRLASNDLQTAATWSGVSLDAAALASTKSVRELSGELSSGKKVSATRVRMAMSGFEQALERSSTRVSSDLGGDTGTSSGTTQSP